MGEWREERLEDCVSDQPSAFATGPFGSAVSARNFQSSGVPMLRGSNLSDDVGVRLDDSNLVFVSEDLAEKYARSIVRHGDLIFTCWGTVGQIGFIDGKSSSFNEYLVSNKQMKMTPDPARVSGLFLYYYLSQPSMVDLVRGQAIGSSVPGFNLGQLKTLRVNMPGLEEQRAIAEVLGTLDDKIAANTHAARIASELAAVYYQQTRLSAVDPESLANLVKTQYGVTTSAKDVFGPRLLRVTDINKHPWIQWDSTPGCDLTETELRKYRLSPGDILVARMADPGKAAMIVDGDPEAVFASYLVRLRPTNPEQAEYIYHFLRSAEYRGYADRVSSGSVQRNMNAKVIVDTEILMPSQERLLRFNSLIRPIQLEIGAVLRENSRLATTRAELLPLLMSGKVRVREAEKAVEGVL